METSIGEEEKEKIKTILSRCDDIKDFHKLHTRKMGTKIVLEFHILVDPRMNIENAHNIASEVEMKIKELFENSCIITIHIEPF